jgi:hypothetical protein
MLLLLRRDLVAEAGLCYMGTPQEQSRNAYNFSIQLQEKK